MGFFHVPIYFITKANALCPPPTRGLAIDSYIARMEQTNASRDARRSSSAGLENALPKMRFVNFFNHSLISTPTVPLGRVAEAAVVGGLEIPQAQQQFQIILLFPHRDEPKQGWRCSHSTWSLDDPWVAFPCV